MNTKIQYLRFQNVNGRVVAFAQLFSEDGKKIFPTIPRGIVDAPLSQVLEYIDREDYEVDNAFEILDALVRKNGVAS